MRLYCCCLWVGVGVGVGSGGWVVGGEEGGGVLGFLCGALPVL